MEMEYMALVMFVVLIVLLMSGYPVAFTLGAVGLLFGIPALGIEFFDLLPLRIWGIMTNFTLLAVPLFVFMGVILEKSGLAEDLLETMAMLFGRLRGGLTVSLVIVGGILAATTGVVGATVVTMAVIALPAMMKNGYQAELSAGTIAASGTLGQLIPPSIILVLLADQVGVPVPRLFAGAVVPGAIMILGFILFIIITANMKPEVAPLASTDNDRRWPEGMGKKVLMSLIPPLVIMFAVLGSIFFGIAGPTESAAFGAVGAMVLATLHKRLSIENIRNSAVDTMRLTSMVFMILVGATLFGLVFRGMGGDSIVHDLMTSLPGGEWGFLLISMLVIFLLGFFLDFLEICFIIVPILAPIAVSIGLDPLWFAILIAVNLQTSFLTPPFGFSLFYLKAAAPSSIRMEQIYRGDIPFIIIQVIILVGLILYPQSVLWLPDWMDSLHGY
jgi:tripartite ATP-independent transporter DctM subunit